MESIQWLGVQLLINAAFLVIAERHRGVRSRDALAPSDALIIGAAQAVALVPGISRSAITIAAARMRSVERRAALDFSFLMATPIIAGASVFAASHIVSGATSIPSLAVIIAGMVAACVASIAAIRMLRAIVARRSLAIFAWYLVPLGLLLCVRV